MRVELRLVAPEGARREQCLHAWSELVHEHLPAQHPIRPGVAHV